MRWGTHSDQTFTPGTTLGETFETPKVARAKYTGLIRLPPDVA